MRTSFSRLSLAHYYLAPLKLLHYAFALAGVLSLCACTAAPSPMAPTALVTVDAAFYREFVQNAFESPARLEPIRLLRGPPRPGPGRPGRIW
jgi:hypothetical protein